jgi:surface protein
MKKTEKTYYDNGNIKEEFEVNTKGDRHGITRMYHDNGQLKFSVTHKNGKQTPGVVISYHNNGVKAREVTLTENGNLNGDFKEWHNNGSIRHEGYYKEDKCFIHKEYDKDGLLIDFKSMRHNNDTLRIAVKEWLDDAVFAEAKYGHISGWDTSEVTDMSSLFLRAKSFNQPLNNWDVSRVTNMSGMFSNAKSFNQPLDKWDVSSVTYMSRMFLGAKSFNQPLEKWDISNLRYLEEIFDHGHKKMIEKYYKQEDDLNISDERQVPDKVYILEGELYRFHYENEKGEILSFGADELRASEYIEYQTGSDYFIVDQIGGEIIVQKGIISKFYKENELYILSDIPEIVDWEIVGSTRTYGEFNTLQEAKDFVNNLKSISFDSINPEDGEVIRYIY